MDVFNVSSAASAAREAQLTGSAQAKLSKKQLDQEAQVAGTLVQAAGETATTEKESGAQENLIAIA